MIDYSKFTGTITVIPAGVVTTKNIKHELINSKGARSLLNVSEGKWDYWRRMGWLPEPIRKEGKKHLYRISDINKLKELL